MRQGDRQKVLSGEIDARVCYPLNALARLRVLKHSERFRTICVNIVCRGTNDTYFPARLVQSKISDITASVKRTRRAEGDFWLQDTLLYKSRATSEPRTPDTVSGKVLHSTFSNCRSYIVVILVSGCNRPQFDSCRA
jgi:hypothetical protein